MAQSEQEIFEKIQGLLEDALGVDKEEVTREARLGPDLGAESIDYLDISFRLEKAFNIKIEQSEMLPDNVLTDPPFCLLTRRRKGGDLRDPKHRKVEREPAVRFDEWLAGRLRAARAKRGVAA